jgi:hypothetical protein
MFPAIQSLVEQVTPQLLTTWLNTLHLRFKKKSMRYCLLLLTVFVLLAGCKEKKADLSGNAPIKVNDFIAAFPALTLPYAVADTNITKVADTLTIGTKAMAQFVPDSVLSGIIGKDKKTSINPIGRIEREKEIYLLANFNLSKKTLMATFVLDKKYKFLAAKQLLDDDNDDGYLHTLSINREPTFTIGKEKMNTEKQQLLYTKTGWAYSSGTQFMQVVNETNEDTKKNNTIINPIDTLPKKNKYSGNYVQDAKNFISIRDTKKPNTYLFFVHFEKDNGQCTGELKGEMVMKTATTAVYSDNGDPCVIDFSFVGNEIIVKEQGSCGNHRGIKCYFKDSYVKKKEVVVKKKK